MLKLKIFRVDQGLRTSCSNPQLPNYPRIPDNIVNQHHQQVFHSQIHHPSLGPPPGIQEQQQAYQTVVNRYATIGRNHHQQYKAPPVPTQLEVELEATRSKAAPAPPPGMKQSHINKANARLVNQNLTRMQKKPPKEPPRPSSKVAESLPLADVRLIADKTVHEPQVQSMQRVSVAPANVREAEPRAPKISPEDVPDTDNPLKTGYGRLVSPAKEAEESDEVDSNPDEDEEEKVRRKTSFPTILMPRPKRKPPFTIEGAMPSFLRRSKKKEKEQDGEKQEDEPAQAAVVEAVEENDEEKPVEIQTPKQKKKTSFNFSKLRVNLMGNSSNNNNNNSDTINTGQDSLEKADSIHSENDKLNGNASAVQPENKPTSR